MERFVIVRIIRAESSTIRKFTGTAFFIDSDTLVTAKHVVEPSIKKGYKLYLSEIPDGGNLFISYNSIKLCNERDMAVIKLKREFDIPKVSFLNKLELGLDVKLIGYHNEYGSINMYQQKISGYINHSHTYEIQDSRTHGLSGSPVIVEDKVCGIAYAINDTKKVTYIIPISELCYDFSSKESLNSYDDDLNICHMLDIHSFITILSKRYMDVSKYEFDVIDKIERERKDFKIKTFHIRRYSFNLFEEFLKLYSLDSKESITTDIKSKLNGNKKHLLIIRDFEYIKDKNIQNEFASILKSIRADNRNFYLIIFGGKDVARLTYGEGDDSFFNDSETTFAKEKKYNLSKNMENITGNHPLLERRCSMYKNTLTIDCKKRLATLAPKLFRNLHCDLDKLRIYLDEDDLGEYTVWHGDELTRDLFWENLLKENNGKFIWRSEYIREIGRTQKCKE